VLYLQWLSERTVLLTTVRHSLSFGSSNMLHRMADRGSISLNDLNKRTQ
jgi:hypothetical protein